jgi:uncharacterized protein (DUF2141 family)
MKIMILGFFLTLINLSTPQSAYRLELIIQNPKSNNGTIQVLIFNAEAGFPDEPKKAFKAFSLPISNLSAKKTIDNLPPGKYAVSVFHDEDGDGKMQKNGVGIPVDRFGFSNNPTLFFGPPSFSKSAFTIKNTPTKVTINLR